MTVIYLYAVLGAGAEVPRLSGLEGVSVQARATAGLTLAVSVHGAPPQLTDAAVLRHGEVVEALAHADAGVLPARFGLAFEDDESLLRSVGERAAELRAALERVRGCAEVGLRVLGPDGDEELRVPAGGGAYLRERLRETTERERLAAELHGAVAVHARESTRRDVSGRRLVLDASYLVPRHALDAFRREVGQLERTHPELAILCTGPWPPYSFTPPAPEAR